MRQSFQPGLGLNTGVDQLISQFSLELLKTDLAASFDVAGPASSENESPVVVACMDNTMETGCSEARAVLSSRGLSMGFNALPPSETLLLEKQYMEQYVSDFLNFTEIM